MAKQFFPTRAENLQKDSEVVRDMMTDQTMVNKAVEAEKRSIPKAKVEVRVKPIGDRLVLRRIEEEQRGIIIVPNSVREPSEKGIVEAVGPGYPDEPTICKVGDVVMVSKNIGVPIEIEGETFVMCRESDLLAII